MKGMHNNGTYASKANFVTKVVEGPDALLGVTDIGELGKAKAANALARLQMNSERC